MDITQKSNTNKIPIKTWDIFIRLFHWCLVVGFFIAYFTQEQDYELHLYSGYFVLFLIIVRILWGFIGTENAKFINFIPTPGKTLSYAVSIIENKAQHYKGHNPLGGYMVLLILTLLLVVSFTGVALDAAENRAGPLSSFNFFYYTNQIDYLHNFSTNIMLLLIGLHIIGVLITSKIQKINLIKAMITGYKNQ